MVCLSVPPIAKFLAIPLLLLQLTLPAAQGAPAAGAEFPNYFSEVPRKLVAEALQATWQRLNFGPEQGQVFASLLADAKALDPFREAPSGSPGPGAVPELPLSGDPRTEETRAREIRASDPAGDHR
jgi:hypothetical protein